MSLEENAARRNSEDENKEVYTWTSRTKWKRIYSGSQLEVGM
jgi:hypothetical protein